MKFESWPTLTAMFFDQADRHGEKPFLWAKREGVYESLSWREAAAKARALAHGLRALGLEPEDRVALVSENRPEWLIADVGIMAAGCITVPAYTTNTAEDHLHVLADSGARAAIVSTAKLAERLLPAAARAPALETVIAIEAPEIRQSVGVNLHSWDEVLARANAGAEGAAGAILEPARGDTACVIYTSGTGGAPKGVVLSHGAILCNCAGAYELLEDVGLRDQVFLCFLPLSHSYEHTAGQFLPISIGAEIYYAEGAETLARNLLEARPTLMTAVPRLYEMMQSRILHEVKRAGGLEEKLFLGALDLGRRRYEDPRGLSLGERVVDRGLDVLVRRRMRRRFGGRLKAMISGGAALSYEAGLFFTALGVRILQGYGQTETAPIVSCNPPEKIKLHTVGPPFKGVEVRIAQDGEILVRGELVMQGYWNDPKSTEMALRDGWLHTGDVGAIDEDGYLRITDRKKDIIVNSAGDNVSPQRIEGALTLEPEIAQAMVYGDGRSHLVALIVPDEEALKHWAGEQGKQADLAALAGDSDFHREIGAALERVNARLSPIEQMRRFTIAPEPFSVANGQLTPTLKIRRHVIGEKYGAALEALYK